MADKIGMIASIKLDGMDDVMAMLNPHEVKRGMQSGLRKVAETTKTLASTLIREEYQLKQADVNRCFSVTATADWAIITAKSRPINLTAFNPRQFGRQGGKRVTTRRKGDTVTKSVRGKAGAFGGVVVGIKRGSTTLLPSAFIAKVAAGNKGGSNIGVFSRIPGSIGRKQYVDKRTSTRPYHKVHRAANPVREQIMNRAMITVSSMFISARVLPRLQEHINNVGIKTIMREVDWAMKSKRPLSP